MVLRLLVQILYPSQKYESPPICNDCSYSIKNYGIEVIFNGNVTTLNFIKIYQLVQKLI
jgi:hypothetical protein